MDTVKSEKLENTYLTEVMDSGTETESPFLGESSTFCYAPLEQTDFQICTDDFSGPLNFDFSLDLVDVDKRHWMYSTVLNKIFIDINRVLPIQFQYNDTLTTLGIQNIQIRALPIYVNPEFQQLCIKRCPIHIMQDNLNFTKKREHILWCEQSDALYEEDFNSKKLCVITTIYDFPSCPYRKTYNIFYQFKCKTSCTLSFNRRPIYVIFTLETAQGLLLGRKKVEVKVCSCPRRDMLREESKRLIGLKTLKESTLKIYDNSTPREIVKTNNNNDENKIYELPVLPVSGKQLYLSTLELLHGHFLGNAVRNDCLIDLHPLISMISDLITRVKSENNNHENDGEPENQLSETNEKYC